MKQIVKIFPTENQYSSIEFHIEGNEEIDRLHTAKLITAMQEFSYVAPKWPKGIVCAICGKGHIAWQTWKSGPQSKNPGKVFSAYKCSTKDCSFIVWTDADKVPSDETQREEWLKYNPSADTRSAKAETKPAVAETKKAPAPVRSGDPSPNTAANNYGEAPGTDTAFMDEELPF